jgi:uncharacterized membrane protein YhiD involved in acid resistance
LVSLASAAFALLSITAFAGTDLSRVAAGAVGMAIGSGNYLLGIVAAVIAGAILSSERFRREVGASKISIIVGNRPRASIQIIAEQVRAKFSSSTGP